ncbi:MAG: hypothetical protein ACYST3_07240 [Planctomycetota bacterium]|jgi:hypothetical protein
MYRVGIITTKLVNLGNGKVKHNVTTVGVNGPIYNKKVYASGDKGHAIVNNLFYADFDTALNYAHRVLAVVSDNPTLLYKQSKWLNGTI